MSLGSKNKLCFITNSLGITKPKVGDTNNMMITWLHKSMDTKIKHKCDVD